MTSRATTTQTSGEVSSAIGRSTMLLVARRVVITALSAASTIVVARWLEPSGYGVLQSAIATWTIVLGICDFGFTLALSREMGRRTEDRAALLRGAYQLQLAWCTVFAVLLAGLGFERGVSTAAGLCLLVLAPSVLASGVAMGRVYYTACYDVSVTVRIDIVVNVVQVLAMISLAVSGAGAVGVACAVGAGTIATSLWIGTRAVADAGPGRATRATRRELIRLVAPLGAMGVVSKIYVSIDVVLLGYFATSADVGQYAAAAKVLALLNTVPALLFASSLPGLSAAFGTELFRALSVKIGEWSVICLAPLFLLTLGYAPLMVEVLVGGEYRQAAGLLRILAVAGLIGVVGQCLGCLLIAANTVRMMLWQNVIACIVNVSLNIALVPTFGATASAWLTVATELLVATFSLVVLLRTRTGAAVAARRGLAVFGVMAVVLVGPALVFPQLVALLVGLVLFVGFVLGFGLWPDELRPRRNGSRT